MAGRDLLRADSRDPLLRLKTWPNVCAMSFYEVIETVGKVIDGIGVAVIALGAIFAAVVTVRKMLGRSGDAYRFFREQLGRSILLGLEFLVAADIIRTVALTPPGRVWWCWPGSC